MATCSSATGTDVPARAVVLRVAHPGDADAITAIYRDEVLGGTSSYETEPPDRDEMLRRMQAVHAIGLPWLVADAGDRIVGFAYAAAYRSRPAYSWTVENSLYVDQDMRGLGVGRRLLETLIEHCTRLGYRRMIAVIGDETNIASVALHERVGFQRAARFPGIGFKHGRWLTGVQMQRALGEGDSKPPAPRGTTA